VKKILWSAVASAVLFLAFCVLYASDWGYAHLPRRLWVMRDHEEVTSTLPQSSIGYDPYFCRANDFRLPPMTMNHRLTGH
jgi:hypothetical protein